MAPILHASSVFHIIFYYVLNRDKPSWWGDQRVGGQVDRSSSGWSDTCHTLEGALTSQGGGDIRVGEGQGGRGSQGWRGQTGGSGNVHRDR